MIDVTISTFLCAASNVAIAHAPLAWPAFCQWIASQAATLYPAPRNESRHARDAAKARMRAFVGAAFSGPRSNDTVGDLTVLPIDVDVIVGPGVTDLDTLLEACSRYRCIVAETASSTPEAPRLRVIPALPAPYPAHAAPGARAAFARELGLDPFACGTMKAAAASQIMFIGGFCGTPERRVWMFDGKVWAPPEPGTAPAHCERDADVTGPTEPVWSAKYVPTGVVDILCEVLAPADATQPASLTNPYRGSRDFYRGLGGWCAKRGLHPDAIETLVQKLPSRDPGTADERESRAHQASSTAWQHYSGDARAAGRNALLEHFELIGANPDDVMARLEDAIADPWVKKMIDKWPTLRRKPSKDAAVLGALSPWVRDLVVAQQEEMRTPIALNIGVAIGAIGACINGHVRARIGQNHVTETGLYVVCVAPTGKKKSPVLRMITTPIEAWVAERLIAQRDEYSKLVVERKLEKLALEKAELDHKRMFGSGDADEAPKLADLIKAQTAWDAGQDPVKFEMLTADATPEVLVDLLAKHGRIACITGEGSKVFNMLSNGSQGKPKAGQADVSVWLDAYDGKLAKVHRIGREAAEPRHKHTTLAALIMTQPIVIQRVVSDPVLCGEGLVSRLTLVQCESTGVRYAPGEIPAPVPQDVLITWDAGMHFLLGLSHGTEVRLSDEAFRVYIAWRDELEPRRSGGDLDGVMSGWAEKTEERAVRIAAGLWACDGAEGREITGEQMQRAVVVTRWLTDHAKQVITSGRTEAKQGALEASVLRHLADGPLTTNAIRQRLGKAQREGLEPALAGMSKAGRIVADGEQWAVLE